MTSIDRIAVSEIFAEAERRIPVIDNLGLTEVSIDPGPLDRFIGWKAGQEAVLAGDVSIVTDAIGELVEPMTRELTATIGEHGCSSGIRGYSASETGLLPQNRFGARIQILLRKGAYHSDDSEMLDILVPYILAFHDRWCRTSRLGADRPRGRRYLRTRPRPPARRTLSGTRGPDRDGAPRLPRRRRWSDLTSCPPRGAETSMGASR